MKKLILSLLAVVALAFYATASDFYMIVHLKDESTVNFAFANKPSATFEGNEMVITDQSDPENPSRFIISDVVKMTVSDEPGLKVAGLNAEALTFSLHSGVLRGSGFEEGTLVRIFSAEGTVVESAAVSSDGTVEIGIANMPKGIYLVSAGKTSFKFIK